MLLGRDCWEIPKVENELYVTESKLIVTEVDEIVWQFEQKVSLRTELRIDYLYVSEDYRSNESDYYHFIIGKIYCLGGMFDDSGCIRGQDEFVITDSQD